MSKHTLKTSIAAAALLIGLGVGSLASAETVIVGLTKPQTDVDQITTAAVKPSSLSVMTLLDRADATYGEGEALRVGVKTNEDAYVTVFNVGPTGHVTQLFPNAFQTDNKVKAGETIEIPGKDSKSQIKVSGPLGAELIKVVATSKPIKIIPDANLKDGGGIFKTVEGDTDALIRDLSVVADAKPEDIKVAVTSQVIKTVPARAEVAGTSAVLVVPTPVPVQSDAPAADAKPGPTFPLLLAADKSTYKVGESVVMGVTSLQACYLSVIAIDEAGKAKLVYPTGGKPFPKIDAMQTVFISGGTATQTLTANAAGEDMVIAHCTSEQRAVSPKVSGEELSEEEKNEIDRDLKIVTSKSTVASGHAQLTLTIKP